MDPFSEVGLALMLKLMLPALMTGALFIYMLRRQPITGSRDFAFMLAALSIWSLAAWFGAMTVPLEGTILWMVLSFLGSQTAAAFFFLFVLRYTQQAFFPSRLFRFGLFLLPAITILLAAIDTWHSWQRPAVTQPQLGVLIFARGPWLWVQLAYNCALVGVSLVLMVRALLVYPHMFSLANRVLLAAALLPAAMSTIYVFRGGPESAVDLASLGFSFSGVLLAWSIIRYGFLRLAPVSYRQILHRLRKGILLIDRRGRVMYSNRTFQRIFHPTHTPRGQPVEQLLKEWPLLLDHIARLIEVEGRAGDEQMVEPAFALQVQGEQQEQLWYELLLQTLFDDRAAFTGLLVTATDITERKEVETTLLAREAFSISRQETLANLNDITNAALAASDLPTTAQALADKLGTLLKADACYITQWDGEKKRAIPLAAFGPLRERYPTDRSNPDAHSMTQSVLEAGHALVAEDVYASTYIDPLLVVGYPTRSLLGLPLIAGGRLLGAALISFAETHAFTAEEVALGEQAAAQISLAMLKNQLLDEAQEARRQAEDINRQLQLAMAELDELATTDPLTGAYNRNKFDELIRYEMGQFERYGQPLSLIMLDIDHYKIINDTYGHHTGDRVLVELVRVMRENIRKTDSLIRWGGEEFMILCPGIALAQGAAMAMKLRGIIAAQVFPGAGSLTVSMGVTAARPKDSLDPFLSRVDDAVYQAKRNGRNRVEIID